MPVTPSSRRRLASLLLASLSALAPARAADHAQEFVPEFNAFVKLNERSRVFLLGDLTAQRSDKTTEVEAGVHIDYTLVPVLRPYLRAADWARDRYLWTRLGYLVLGDPEDGQANISEHRVIVELTGRTELPYAVWLINRTRVDFRDIDGADSQRYRFRLGVEREFIVSGVTLVPYAQAEIFYDTRYDRWNRQLYQAGVEIELSNSWRLEPYLARQNDSVSASGNANRLGLVLKFFR